MSIFCKANIAKSLQSWLFHALHTSTYLEITSDGSAGKRFLNSCNDPTEYKNFIVTVIFPSKTSSFSLAATLRAGMHAAEIDMQGKIFKQ